MRPTNEHDPAGDEHDHVGERGAMHVAAIPAVVGLLALAALLIVVLGAATSDRRESATAADAAALAAAQEWDRYLHDDYASHVDSSNHAGFWGLVGQPVLSTGVYDEMVAEASEYAVRNGTHLVDLDVDTARGEVRVRVRNAEEVPETDTQMNADATARIELTGGLCIEQGMLGYRIGGQCVTVPAPEPTPSPTPTPTATPTGGATPTPTPTPPPPPPPEFEPPSVDAYRSDVHLVD